jgi:hypothetical protein
MAFILRSPHVIVGLFLAGLVSLAVLGCPPADDVGDDDDDIIAPPGSDNCTVDTDCSFQSGLEICGDQGLCVQGDRNNSMEEAQLLEDGDTTELYIAPAGDVDWFRFNGNQGDLIYIAASAEDTDNLDCLVTYYDSGGNEIGFADDFDRVSGVAPDARFYSGVPATGTAWFSVQDKRSWANDPTDPATGGSGHKYQLFFAELGASAGADLAAEPNDTVTDASPWEVSKYATNYNLGGGLAPAGDVDWLAVDVIQGEVLRLYGFPGSGSQGTTRLTAYLPDATTEIRSYEGLAWDLEHRAWIPVLETGTYYLEIEDSAGGGGFDHWYFLHAAKNDPADGYPAEVEPNNESGSAETLDLSPVSGTTVETTLWGRIGAAGDEDYYTITAESGDRLSVTFARTDHGETTGVQVRLVNPGAVAFQCPVAPGDDDDSAAGDDDDSAAGDDDDSAAGDDDDSASAPLPACCTDGSCDSPIPVPVVWSGGEDSVFPAQELSAGTWNLVVSDSDASVGDGGRYYQMTVSQERP